MDTLLYVLTFALIAAATYFIDKRFGAPMYRSCYNLWHKEPLSDGVLRGFIVGRKTKERILPSFVLTIFFGFLLSYSIRDPIELVMKSPLIFIGLSIGFMLTGFAMREGKKPNALVDKVCEAMDTLEEGNVDLGSAAGNAVRKGAKQAGAALAEVSASVTDKVEKLMAEKPAKPTPSTKTPTDETDPSPTEAKSNAPKKSFQDALDAFTNRR